ncbi:DNA-processing protein DprA [Syntrophus sp. (in: bacteria)]|uniref:DNA-processing protein DprA n=1 Tax=Syntrophus sp. (in: bacteria) TaxID=48412 RepID=UPI00345EFBB4
MENNELLYWLALRSASGIGNVTFKSLLGFFPSPYHVFQATYPELLRIPGIGPKTASAIKGFHQWQKLENELKELNKFHIHLVTLHDREYPGILKNIFDYPPLLYVKGTLEEGDLNIAMVGSRMASTYGVYTTERLARELAMNGMTIVSGMARGIDSAAHRGALAGRGRTIAVLGCGLDVIYPPENKDLYKNISENGAVISEYAPGTPPNAPNFPMRNRIISGLSLGVVVVEANERSGSLITARIAMEQGREVFAVPGSIDFHGSRGSHRLIKEGAKLIENVDDVLEEILPQIRRTRRELLPGEKKGSTDLREMRQPDQETSVSHPSSERSFSEHETMILNLLASGTVDIDTIIAKSGLSVNETMNCLLNLELYDAILQLPGKLYKRKETPCPIP